MSQEAERFPVHAVPRPAHSQQAQRCAMCVRGSCTRKSLKSHSGKYLQEFRVEMGLFSLWFHGCFNSRLPVLETPAQSGDPWTARTLVTDDIQLAQLEWRGRWHSLGACQCWMWVGRQVIPAPCSTHSCPLALVTNQIPGESPSSFLLQTNHAG